MTKNGQALCLLFGLAFVVWGGVADKPVKVLAGTVFLALLVIDHYAFPS